MIHASLLLLTLQAGAMAPTVEKNYLALPSSAAPCNLDIHKAIESADDRCLEQAITHMDINDRSEYGDTALHEAIRAKNLKAVRFLLKNQADMMLRDFQGQTARELAEGLGFQEIAHYLLSMERESERLAEAVDRDDLVAASNSLQRGAPLGTRDNIRLDSLLHKAAQSNLTEMAALLIKHGANLEARNYLGETPLHSALLRGFRETTIALVKAGANVNALDERRFTAYDIVVRNGFTDLEALFKKHHAREGTATSVEFDFGGSDGQGSEAPAVGVLKN